MTLILAAVAFLFSAFALYTVLPGFCCADLMLGFPLAQIIPFRLPLAGFCIILGLFYLYPALRAHTKIRRIIAAITALILLGAGAIHISTVTARGFSLSSAQATPLPENLAGTQAGNNQENTATPAKIKLLTYNTQGGATTPAQIAQLMLDYQIDAAVLPETATRQGEEIRAALAAAGAQFQQFDTHTSDFAPAFSSTVLLISTQLGKYRQLALQEAAHNEEKSVVEAGIELFTGVKSAGFSIVGAAPATANTPLPTFYGVHPVAPLPFLLQRWRSEINQTYSICAKDENFIMAGDFNSTADHQAAFGRHCTDVLAQARIGGLGTWPANLPVWLGAPIDRVLSSGKTYTGTQGRIVKVGQSDHAGVVVELAATGNAQ